MISSRAEVYVYLRGERLSCVKLVGKQYQQALLYLEELSPLFTAKLQIILYTLLLLLLLLLLSLLLPLLFIHCLHVCMLSYSLTLAHSHFTHTNLTHRPIPKRGYATLRTMATADALSLKSLVWHYFGFPLSYVDNVRVVDSLQTFQKLDGRLF